MININITADNFINVALNWYDNPQCATFMEFEDDLKRFLYIKKLFSRYHTKGILKERLILNHIVILYNLFGNVTTNMLFYKIDISYWKYLIPFLMYIERMPDIIPNTDIQTDNIPLDQTIIDSLRKL